MFESKYSKVLTVILVIVIVAIVGLLGFLAFDFFQNYLVTNDASQFVEDFNGEVNSEGDTSTASTNTVSDESNPFEGLESSGSNSNSSSTTTKTYKGFGVVGTMRIPATDFEYPILEKVTKKSIETAVAFQYGAGINQVGNSVIIGHNYRNGLFFSNNKKLQIGDKIYIKDNSGTEMTYTIYDKFETTPEDTLFYQRDTAGRPEVTLSTCTDDSSARLIILARVEG